MSWNILRVQSLNSTAFRRLHGRLMASRFLPCHSPVTTYSGGVFSFYFFIFVKFNIFHIMDTGIHSHRSYVMFEEIINFPFCKP